MCILRKIKELFYTPSIDEIWDDFVEEEKNNVETKIVQKEGHISYSEDAMEDVTDGKFRFIKFRK